MYRRTCLAIAIVTANNYGLISLTEMWLTPVVPVETFFLAILKSIEKTERNSSNSKRGGTLIAIEKSIKQQVVPVPVTLKQVSLKLLNTDGSYIILSCIYNPPPIVHTAIAQKL